MWTYSKRFPIGRSRVERQGSQFCSPAPSANTPPSALTFAPPSFCTPPRSNHSQSHDPMPTAPDTATDPCSDESISITIAPSYAFFPSAHLSTTAIIPAPFPDNPPTITTNASYPTTPSPPHPFQTTPCYSPKSVVPHGKCPNTHEPC